MDHEVIGRGRADEAAILEELSGAEPVGRPDRRWLLAIAGMAAIVCMGIAGNYAAPAPKERDVAIPKEGLASPPSGTDQLPIAPPRAAIEFVRPVPESVVTKGSIPIELRAAAGSYIHVSLTIGAAVLGWRMVDVDDRGRWSGTLSVFAPQVALPAMVRAAGSIDGSQAEADAAITIGAGPPIQVWSAWVRSAVRRQVHCAVSSRCPARPGLGTWMGHRQRLGAASGTPPTRLLSTTGSQVRRGRATSALAASAGLFRSVGRRRRPLTLHISWKDPLTKASGTLERALDPRIAAFP